MKFFKSTSLLLFILAFISTLYIPSSQYSIASAAPVSSSSSSVVIATPECRKCLSEELHNIGICGQLSEKVPLLSQTEKDPSKINEYKTKYPDAVKCLCLASSQAQGPRSWVSKCNSVCTVDVEIYQKRTLSRYSKQLSCGRDPAKQGSFSSFPATAVVTSAAKPKNKPREPNQPKPKPNDDNDNDNDDSYSDDSNNDYNDNDNDDDKKLEKKASKSKKLNLFA
ncbi:hypothetical protein BGZ49_008940 [Haplosporangium sp. Z 27]|nr:hypothetical protein BGZ49_008940 [Haplosporangium sp. Z 27]